MKPKYLYTLLLAASSVMADGLYIQPIAPLQPTPSQLGHSQIGIPHNYNIYTPGKGYNNYSVTPMGPKTYQIYDWKRHEYSTVNEW